MTTLIIARHGNTFEKDQTPRRVGLGTDIDLVEKGKQQARAIGHYLRNNNLIPDVVYSSALKRARHTAEIAIQESGYKQPVYVLDIFNEIDYGPDENKTEQEVIARIGEQSLKAWDQSGEVPEGWNVDPEQIISNWIDFSRQIAMHDDGEIALVVTSNGIARFAPHITGDFEEFSKQNGIKIGTGCLCILEHTDSGWSIKDWNVKP
jgi:probable phosphoglycerate mutase